MTITDYELVGSYNNQRISEIDSERTVNLFEYHDLKGKKNKVLLPTAGIVNTNVDLIPSTQGFRASFYFNNNTYHVVGANIFLIKTVGSSLSSTLINAAFPLGSVTGYVGIDANSFQVIFVDGLRGYIFDTQTLLFLPITDPAFPANPIDVAFLDGYFVVANGGTNNFQLSAFEQGLVWGSDFASATGNTFTVTTGSPNIVLTSGSVSFYQVGTPVTFNAGVGGALPTPLSNAVTYFVNSIINGTTFTISLTKGGTSIAFTGTGTTPFFVTDNGQLQEGSITTHPGNIVACRTLHRRLFLFSDFFTEVWENAGIGTNLPFRRNNSLLIERGTPALGSISVAFDIMVFLSQSRNGQGPVVQVNGSQAIPVSTKALDNQLSKYAANQQVADCRGFLIKERELVFYRMNFTLANHTFVYDVTQSDPSNDEAKLWHEEEVLNGNRHPTQTHVYYQGQHYAGHYSLPILYRFDNDVFTNDGENIKRLRIGKPFVPPGYQRLRVDRFQVDLLQGQIQDELLTNEPIDTEGGIDILTETGDTIITSQTFNDFGDTDPVLFLQYSKDGGQTFGGVLTGTMGETGQRTFRTVYRKLGTTVRGQAFVPQVYFYNNLPFYLLGAGWSFEVLPE